MLPGQSRPQARAPIPGSSPLRASCTAPRGALTPVVGTGFLSWSRAEPCRNSETGREEPQPLAALPSSRVVLGCCSKRPGGGPQGLNAAPCGNGDLRWGTRRLCRKCYIITTAATRSKVLVSSRVTRLRGGTEASARVTGMEALPRAQGCWGRGAGPCQDGRLCPGGLSFGLIETSAGRGPLRSPAAVRSLCVPASGLLLPAQRPRPRAWLSLWGADICLPSPTPLTVVAQKGP